MRIHTVSHEAQIIALCSRSEDSHNASFVQCPSVDRFCVLAQSSTNGREGRARMAAGSLARPDRESGSVRLGSGAMAIFAAVPFARWGRRSRRSKHAVVTTRPRCWLALSRVGTCTSSAESSASWSHAFMLDLHLKTRRHTSKAQLLYRCCVSALATHSLQLQELGAVCTQFLCARHRRLYC